MYSFQASRVFLEGRQFELPKNQSLLGCRVHLFSDLVGCGNLLHIKGEDHIKQLQLQLQSLIYFNISNMGVSKNSGIPKMDGENNGKPYFLMDDLGVPPFKETPISILGGLWRSKKSTYLPWGSSEPLLPVLAWNTLEFPSFKTTETGLVLDGPLGGTLHENAGMRKYGVLNQK